MGNQTETLNLLDRQLDEASEKYIFESLNGWKESVMAQLLEEVERIKEEKLESLERENELYREELKEQYAEKMLNGISELKESVRAEMTGKILRDNPELRILEQIKELVAPTLSESYASDSYADEIRTLSEENEKLKRELELREGADTLASLLAPYNEKTRNFVLGLIKEGSSEEVTEQFYSIFEGLEAAFGKDGDKEGEDEGEDGEKDGKDGKEGEGSEGDDGEGAGDDGEGDDKGKGKKKSEDEGEDGGDEGEGGDDPAEGWIGGGQTISEGYIDTMKKLMKSYARK